MKRVLVGFLIIILILTSFQTINGISINNLTINQTNQLDQLNYSSESNDCGCDDDFEEKDNEKLLQEIKNAIEESNAHWEADYNSVFTPESSVEVGGLGCILDDNEYEEEYNMITFSRQLPDQYDWRDIDGKDWVTTVKDQKGCGSCVAFGTLSALEAVVQIELNQMIKCDFSESNIFFCGGGSCSSGWQVSEAVNFLEEFGVADESCFPYIPKNQPCENSCPDWLDRAVKVTYGGRVGGLIIHVYRKH